MSWFDLINHVLNLLAPALALAVCLATAARWALGRKVPQPSWGKQVLVLACTGAVVLGLGLLLLGRDGRMATYVALVLTCGNVQWLLLRGWQR